MRLSLTGLAPLFVLVAVATPAHAATAAASAPPLSPADSLYAAKDWARAAKAYEAMTKTNKTAPRPFYRLGVCYSSLGQWAKAIAPLRTAASLGTPPQFAQYNLACAYARTQQPDSAFAALGRVMDAGYRQPDALRDDADLASLHADARFAAIVERAQRNQTPCAFAPESRQFDFWIGDWDVHTKQPGAPKIGTSHVERILGQCVIFENWTDIYGSSGKSFNAYNPQTHCWQQHWVDDTGVVTNYDVSTFKDGVLEFLADSQTPQGAPTKLRLSFHALGPDEVRQWGEQSTDGGTTWAPLYDFLYERVAK